MFTSETTSNEFPAAIFGPPERAAPPHKKTGKRRSEARFPEL
jgi:hypothetical protein